jgi:hypothetical protein
VRVRHVVVQQTTVTINTFVIVNLAGPGYIDRPAGTTGDRDTPSTYTGDDTTSSTETPSTVAPTTATTEPVSTLPPADFCAQFQAIQSKWTGANTDTLSQRQGLMADFDRLTAAAPADVRADMQTIDAFLRQTINSDDPAGLEPPADVQAAEVRVTAYLTNVCGIVIG